MFKNFSNYQRESSKRHQSERLLDRNLVHAHKKIMNDNVKDMKKAQELQQKSEIAKKDLKAEQLNSKYANVTTDDMLKKL